MSLHRKLLSIQSALKPIPKDNENPYFKSAYFDINSVLERLKPACTAHELVLLQPLTEINGKPAIKTILIDAETSETIEATFPLIENADPQKLGAIVTYTRRYALVALFCLEAEDDDAESVLRPQKAQSAPLPMSALSRAGLLDKEPFASNEPAYVPTSYIPTNIHKTCTNCGKQHTGKYNECYACYLSKKK